MGTKRKIFLSGELAKHFGRVHEFVIATPGEAIRALCANFPDFQQHLSTAHERGVGYKVLVDRQPLGAVDNVHSPFSQVVRIVPVITGGKSSFLGIVLGVALIAASFFVPGLAAVSLGAGASLASVAFGVGASLVLGGVAQMLSPQPKAMEPSERPENKPSYTFNGPVNTTSQGQCVPVGYGRLIVGSAVISAGLVAAEYADGAIS